MQRAYGLDIPATLSDLCDPRHMAVLIYDMQAGIVSQISDGARVTERVVDLIEAARAGGFRIVYLRHMYLPKEMAGISQLRTAMAWQRVERVRDVKSRFLQNSPEFQLAPGISPHASEVVFDKITMSAFVGTPLDIVLRDCGIESFAIAGIALEIGIEPTVRHAMDLGYIPVLVTDACGSGDKAAGERSLASLAAFGGSVQTEVSTLAPLLRRCTGPPMEE
jgi:nicotinamidase-related amidase